MSSLGDWMEGVFHPRRPGGLSEPTVREHLQALRDHYGSNRAVARELGINESTVRRHLSGAIREPKAGTAGMVEKAYRAVSVRQISNEDLKMSVTQHGHSKRKPRSLGPKNFKITDPKAADRIRNAYVSGGAERAAMQFLKEVKDRHYRDYLAPDDLRARLEGETGSEVVDTGYGYEVVG